MGRFAFVFAFKFVVTLPNHSAIFIGGVPHLRAEESTTVSADDTGGENALSAVLATDSFAPLKFGLHLVELLWCDNWLMAVLHIVLWHFPLVHFLLFGKEIHREAFLRNNYGIDVILFSISNYFLRFSNMYIAINGEHSLDDNNWYEFVEYGTTNEITVFLQRNGFSRASANYIKDHPEYIFRTDEGLKLRRTLLECKNNDARTEEELIALNRPKLFEET